MDRIFNPDQVTDDRRFTEGDGGPDNPATPLVPKWLNDAQEEICAVIEGAGLTLDPNNQAQLLQAIRSLAGPAGASYITAEGSNANGHWRQWSNGAIEQWGRVDEGDMGGNSSRGTAIFFPIAYPDMAYQALMTVEMGLGSQVVVYADDGYSTESKLGIQLNNVGVAATAVRVNWRTMSV